MVNYETELQCLHVALEYADDISQKQQGYFPDVVEVATTIVRESVNRLIRFVSCRWLRRVDD
ncbi:MAG: hypothetical protein QM808_05885 [Steroidobacteraceae bacterium]